MRSARRVLLASTALLLVASAGLAQQGAVKPARGGATPPARGRSAVSPGALRAVATVNQIMVALMLPSSDAVFDAASEPPTTDQGWATVATSAVVLAEAGNLLMIGSRAKDKEAWMKMARAQVDAAEAVMKAATAKNAESLSKTGDALYETCDACHTRYTNKDDPR